MIEIGCLTSTGGGGGDLHYEGIYRRAAGWVYF